MQGGVHALSVCPGADIAASAKENSENGTTLEEPSRSSQADITSSSGFDTSTSRSSAFYKYSTTMVCKDPSLTRPRQNHSIALKLSLKIAETYKVCDPRFNYSVSFNPRRPLSKPAEPVSNDGWDNENADLILYVNDSLLSSNGNRYIVKDMLGQGTFGQVAKCVREDTGEVVAVKVIKNRPAYYHQARVEIGIVQMLNSRCDPENKHHIVRMLDYFIHRRHLCLAFELLNINLYELIRQN